MSMKEFKKRINQTKEQQRKKDIARGYINKSNKSIFRINNSNIEIIWSDNISIREKDYSIQAVKEINLQDRIKGDKIFLSRYCDTTNDFIVKDNLNNKIVLETI